jgi:hypothetical protein
MPVLIRDRAAIVKLLGEHGLSANRILQDTANAEGYDEVQLEDGRPILSGDHVVVVRKPWPNDMVWPELVELLT